MHAAIFLKLIFIPHRNNFSFDGKAFNMLFLDMTPLSCVNKIP